MLQNTSYKYWEKPIYGMYNPIYGMYNPIYGMYNPIEITSY